MNLPGSPFPDVTTAAITYLKAGISVIPVVGKKAAIRWQPYQYRLAHSGELANWKRWGKFHNIAVVCGQVSGNLVVIDLDGQNAVRLFTQHFPVLAETYTVITGSGQGKHLYLQVDTLPPTTRAMNIPGGGNIELRANGCYVVAPPSIHPTTRQPYRVERPLNVLGVDTLDTLRQWLLGLNPSAMPSTPKIGEKRAISFGFAAAALRGEINALRAAAEGNRNNRLNLAAYNLGQLVGDNHIPRWQVEDELIAAARAVGLPEGESQRTIKSGLDAGIRNPRSRRYG